MTYVYAKEQNMAGQVVELCGISRRKASQSITFCVKKERNASYKKVASILQKDEKDRSAEEKDVLLTCSDLVQEVTQRVEKRQKVKDRLLEIQDPEDELERKCRVLAEALANSQHLVVYTGAGISTSACIPDYRGTNGIWTLLQQGKDIGLHDLTQAEPTYTHMALSQLHRARILRHVVSQNCDGLHLRSGLPKFALSEVHGNMYIEVCHGCKREYWRLFDVTENTARYSHRTMRRCYKCSKPLQDTIVHFGERGTLQWPLNWPGASQGANKADVILCIGSSLKVLKKYPWLWGMDKPAKKRPKLYIINLQWTPKDDQAVLKINGKCDEIMKKVMVHLNLPIPHYVRDQDPMFSHATPLNPLEEHTTSQPNLKLPSSIASSVPSTAASHDGIKKEQSFQMSSENESTTLNNETHNFSAHHKDSKVIHSGICGGIEDDPSFLLRFKSEQASSGSVKTSMSQETMVSILGGKECKKKEVAVMNCKIKEENLESGFHFVSVCEEEVEYKFEAPFNQCNDPFLMETGAVIDTSLVKTNVEFVDTISVTSSMSLPIFCALSQSFQMDHNYSKCSIKSNQTVKSDCKSASPESCDVQKNSITRNKNECGRPSCDEIKSYVNESTKASSSYQQSCTRSYKAFTSMCSFCDQSHRAQYCLYYSKHDPTFMALENSKPGESIPICECCDCSDDDEEDASLETNDSLNVKEDEAMEVSSETTKVPIINPGWYGKGYRKRVKKKR